MSDFNKRLITAILGIAILFVVFYFGGFVFSGFIFLISVFASLELYNAFKRLSVKIDMLSILLGSILVIFLNIYKINLSFSIIFIFLLGLIRLIFDNKFSLTSLCYTVFVFIYVPFMFGLLNTFNFSQNLLYLVFIISFSTDTFAYLVGSKFGKHKLIEKVSPNKSVEGAIGGILGAVFISIIYFARAGFITNMTTIIFVIVASISGQIGDLAASKIKRVAGIKDYSKLLPGHGGIMDRFDSIIVVIPIIYIMSYFII